METNVFASIREKVYGAVTNSWHLSEERAAALSEIGGPAIDRSVLQKSVDSFLTRAIEEVEIASQAEPPSECCWRALTMLGRLVQAAPAWETLIERIRFVGYDDMFPALEWLAPPYDIRLPKGERDPGLGHFFNLLGCLLATAYARSPTASNNSYLERSICTLDVAAVLMPGNHLGQLRELLEQVRQVVQTVQTLFLRVEQEEGNPEAVICGQCIDLNAVHGFHESKFTSHYMNFKRVCDAAARRCRFCMLLRAAVASTYAVLGITWEDIVTVRYENRSMGPTWWGKGDKWLSDYLWGSDKPLQILITTAYGGGSDPPLLEYHSIQLYMTRGSPGIPDSSIVVQKSAESPRPWPILGYGSHVSSEPDSPRNWDLIRDWIHTCPTLRTDCADGEDHTLPTRVIAVGTDETSPRLHLSSVGEHGKYAALSHCWGSVTPLRTFKHTVDQLRLGIDLSELPKTFRDAVTICRKLGLPFLWIDSLCIIQDDAGDWEAESARMDQIYTNAFITIAAAAAHDSTGGCFIPRPFHTLRELATVAGAPPFDSVKVYARPWVSWRPWVGNIGDGPQDTEQHPLETRAWTLQEHLLSRRILRFTAHELVWQCRTAIRCECVPGDISHKSSPRPLSPVALRSPTYTKYGDPRHIWDHVVQAFSGRAITHESDRLPALSGIASRLSAAKPVTYVGGMWKEFLIVNLSWRTRARGCSRSPAYGAPSWSWASVTGEVDTSYWAASNPLRTTKVIRVEYTLATPNPFGRLSSASLTITGVLFHVRVVPPAEPDRESDSLCEGGFDLQFPDELSSVFGEGMVKRAHAWPDLRMASYEAPELDTDASHPLLIVAVPIVATGYSAMVGVLLIREQGGGSGDDSTVTYQRVGAAKIWMQDEGLSFDKNMDNGLAIRAANELVEKGYSSTVTIV